MAHEPRHIFLGQSVRLVTYWGAVVASHAATAFPGGGAHRLAIRRVLFNEAALRRRAETGDAQVPNTADDPFIPRPAGR